MKAKSLYIQKLAYDENTGNEIIGLFPSEANPAIVSSYTYDAKRMGGAPTLTATIYSSEPLQWKKEEFVEYNGDRFFASYTPNSTKDNSSRMWKSEITFTSRRELLDNTLFFDVVVDDVDTQNKDRYRSNQTKFTFGGTIHEFVARVNSSMAYCGLYRPTDEYKGYYVVVDEGYGTDEVKEVSFEDQYLTDVLQLINTTFELDYYWDGNVCHVGKVQHDLTDTPIKYGSSDALISVSKENANYKIVDMITGYGSSDNLPYYYPNDDEFGEAVFNVENADKSQVSIRLSKAIKCLGNINCYNNKLSLYKVANSKETSQYLDFAKDFGWFSNGESTDGGYEATKTFGETVRMWVEAKSGTTLDFTSVSVSAVYKGSGLDGNKKLVKEQGTPKISVTYKNLTTGDEEKTTVSNVEVGTTILQEIIEDGIYQFSVSYTLTYKSTFYRVKDGQTGITMNVYASRADFDVTKSGGLTMSYTPSVSDFSFKDSVNDKFYGKDELGIVIPDLQENNYGIAEYRFDRRYDADPGRDVYFIDLKETASADKQISITITDRIWLDPSQNLMPSIYRNTQGSERFYYATDTPPKGYEDIYKIPGTDKNYTFKNKYVKGNPHQGSVSFDDIKPTINGIRNDVIQEDGLGQLFGEIADVAFDKEDSDVKDSDGKYIHNYFYIKLHKFNGDFGFDLFAHALASEPAKINLIKSNGCPACSFTIGCYWNSTKNKCYNNVLTDGNGNLKSESGKMNSKGDYILNDTYVEDNKSNQDSTKEELWICVQKDTSTLGIIMPNANAGFKPQKGDLFVITGIKPPKVLVTAAEKRLDDALIKHMSENNTDQFNYSVKFSRIFLQENPDFASKLNENAKLSIQIQGDSDNDGNLISHEVFVSNYSVKVDNEDLAEVEIELVNSLEVTKSDVKQIIDAVKGETVKSLSSMAGGSNTNSFNASITDKMYLSKLTDDIASGTITFQKVQKFVQGFFLGHSNEFSIDGSGNAILSSVLVNLLKSLDFNESEQSGFAIKQRSDGKFQMLLTDLIVWGKAIFNTLLIRELSYVGGNIVLSPAAGKISYIKEVYSETTNEMIGWKCYLLADDGTTATINSFKVEDQVRCKTFNIAPGVYENVSNKDYWRLVTKVSTENEAITDDEGHELYDGKKFAWIQIAKDNCMEGSDNPAVGDTIVLMGNRSDKSRQHLLMMETEGDSAPRFTMYRGINTYSLKNKSIFDVSFDGINIVSKYFNMVSVSGEKVWTPVYRGDWKEGTEYSYYDEVTWLGTRWLCISSEGQTTTDEPSEDSPYWKATTNIYKPQVILYTDIVYSGIAIGETHNITCKLMLGDKDVSNGVASWKVTRKTNDSVDDAAWATKEKVKNFNGSIDIVWSNDGTEDDIGKGDTAKFIFTATTTTGKIHQEYIKV